MKQIITENELRKKILEFFHSNRDEISWYQLREKFNISEVKEKRVFKDTILHLEQDGILLLDHHKQINPFPLECELDQIVMKNDRLFLKNNQVELKSTFTETLLPLDSLIIEKDGAIIKIKKIVKRNIEEVMKYLIKEISEGQNFNMKEILRIFKAFDSKSEEVVKNYIEVLEKVGKLYCNEQQQYQIFPDCYQLTKLELNKNGRPYFYLGNEQIFVTKEDIEGAVNQDRIVVDKASKKIIKILDRKEPQMLLDVIEVEGVKVLKPFLFADYGQMKVRISSSDMKKLVVGDRILVSMVLRKSDEYYEAKFLKKLGRCDEPDIDLKSIALSCGFPLEFSNLALEEAYSLPTMVREEERKFRLDLRDKHIFTIDSVSTKDMDDAVSLEILENGNYLLGVHIAHVSHYIKKGMQLYDEAMARGTSLYMMDSVIPMLPSIVSNGICSLNQGVDRLTKSCMMEIDSNGNVLNYSIVDSVICSKLKMNYEAIQQFFETGKIEEAYYPYLEDLKNMLTLSNILSKKREQAGYLFFDSSDIKGIYNEDHKLVNFEVEKMGDAHKLIENFMVEANICVDYYLRLTTMASINRIHEAPDHEKLEEAIHLLKELRYPIRPLKGTQDKYVIQDILLKYSKTEDFKIISDLLLKSQKRARYSTDEIGHFGLGTSYYTHFTSPIRRAPDLKNQEMLDQVQNNRIPSDTVEELEEFCKYSSYKERQATLAENKATELKMMEYIEEHLGDHYTGLIMNIDTKHILFKTDNQINGYIDYHELNTSLTFNEKGRYLKNEAGNMVAKVGDHLLVEAVGTDHSEMKAQFEVVKNLTLEKKGLKGATALKPDFKVKKLAFKYSV